MVMMSSALCRCLTLRILKILLNGGKILLGSAHISGLQVLRELIECLSDWIIASACAAASGTARGCASVQKLDQFAPAPNFQPANLFLAAGIPAGIV